jgi:ribosome-associated protein
MIPETLYPELKFHASRSSGAGGQHVNKVNTRVELRFDILASSILAAEEKDLLMQKLASRVTREGVLIVVSEKTRSQMRNKQNCLERFDDLIIKAFTPDAPRVATKPGFHVKRKRLEMKKQLSEKKQNRRKPDL